MCLILNDRMDVEWRKGDLCKFQRLSSIDLFFFFFRIHRIETKRPKLHFIFTISKEMAGKKWLFHSAIVHFSWKKKNVMIFWFVRSIICRFGWWRPSVPLSIIDLDGATIAWSTHTPGIFALHQLDNRTRSEVTGHEISRPARRHALGISLSSRRPSLL